MSASYLRFPHLALDRLVFVANDDLWLAPRGGGLAARLTADHVPVTFPRLSPDASKVAFVSVRDGSSEVYLLSLGGGPVTRLTWFGGTIPVRIFGWKDERTLWIGSGHDQPTRRRLPAVRELTVDGELTLTEAGPAWGYSVAADGTEVVATPGSRPPAWWKRYRGGTAPRLHRRRPGGDWERLLAEDAAGLVDPIWVGEDLYFVSDRDVPGVAFPRQQANLFRWPGGDTSALPVQVTFNTAADGYVRDATTDGRSIVWHSRGRLWILNGHDQSPVCIEVTTPGIETGRIRLDHRKNIGPVVPNHEGTASVAQWRGSVWILPHRRSATRAVALADGQRNRLPGYIGSGALARIGWVAAPLGRWGDRFFTADADGGDQKMIPGDSLGWTVQWAASPDGRRVALAAHDGTVRIIELSSDEVRVLHVGAEGIIDDLRFSPSGRYLVWSEPTAMGERDRLMLADFESADAADAADSVAVRPLTTGEYTDTEPVFDAEESALYFLSRRTLDPIYDEVTFGLALAATTRPWAVPLEAGPAAWCPAPYSAVPAEDSAIAETGGTVPDLVEFERRAAALPVSSSNFHSLQAVDGGLVWIRSAEVAGHLGTRHSGAPDGKPADVVEFFDAATGVVTKLLDAAEQIAVSGDGKRLVAAISGAGQKRTVLALAATKKTERDDRRDDHHALPLEQLRADIDFRADLHQQFTDTVELMRENFWRADMDGVDWDGHIDRWRPVVDRVSTTNEFHDVLWEVVGELNTSHAYVIPAATARHPAALGLLGGDLRRDEHGWVVDAVLRGESSDPQARAPLSEAGVVAGERIIAVSGRGVPHQGGPAALLAGTVNVPVELTIAAAATEATVRRVIVTPIADDTALRYQGWVQRNRDYVAEHTGGAFGYLHLPDMQAQGWAQMHRDYEAAVAAEALIVDVRDNGGGHTSSLVVAALLKRIAGHTVARHYREPRAYQKGAPRGPIVLVANRRSGSDGDIVNAAAKELGFATVIGERTWGGVVGVDRFYDLVDGTVVTQPRYHYSLTSVGGGVENHGVDPDILIDLDPSDFTNPADRHLDAAIAHLRSELATKPTWTPPPLDPPRFPEG